MTIRFITTLSLLAWLVVPLSANAQCYADYKAKKDNPLKLHYGVIQVPDELCSAESAEDYISGRVAQDGWILLGVISLFGPEGLEQRRTDADEYFLRY